MDDPDRQNPFALVKASDFSDAQIHELWVELGAPMINKIIEPRLRTSKYILGGKGTGKTHLLRYHSYQVARLRYPHESGLETVARQKYLGIFIRAANVDPGRFEPDPAEMVKWQRLFGVYLELWLAQRLLEALTDIQVTSPTSEFNDHAVLEVLTRSLHGAGGETFNSLSQFADWLQRERRNIDHAVDNAAFSGELDVRVSFSIGGLCAPLGLALRKWHPALADVSLIFMIDEIENFSAFQQEVLNSLIRYAEGVITFRVTGRLYSIKTTATMAKGEENREGAEFKTTTLDDMLRAYRGYGNFAKAFVKRRLSVTKLGGGTERSGFFDPTEHLDDVDPSAFYEKAIGALGIEPTPQDLARRLTTTLSSADPKLKLTTDDARGVSDILILGLPVLLQRLNILLFCKKYRKTGTALAIAQKLREAAEALVACQGKGARGTYATAYQHYSKDLFAQVCRESKVGGPIYAGFETFVKMSSGNPRNLLIVLGRMHEMATFREMSFEKGQKLSVRLQTEAAIEAARFLLESDTNYGGMAEQAREAITKLALTLRTARFSLSIPEVSPLAVSFAIEELKDDARVTLNSALNYSLLFEVPSGRPDRNSQKVLKKAQLNPLLSPKWGLSIGRRGDLSLGKELCGAIFGPGHTSEFDVLLKALDSRWNNPFKKPEPDSQPTLF
ncbi:MAG: hypothetical protein V4843_13050 [Pseudomonadota bacterium]